MEAWILIGIVVLYALITLRTISTAGPPPRRTTAFATVRLEPTNRELKRSAQPHRYRKSSSSRCRTPNRKANKPNR
jgi:hypothetical protein